MKDEHGQAPSERINRLQRSQREVDELIGICKGLASDGVVNQGEAQFLHDWLKLSSEARDEWPGDLLFLRLESMLRDGRLDDREGRELLQFLVKASGGDATRVNAASLSAGLPLSTPQPKLEFPERKYCFTGRFVFGTREKCEAEVLSRGGDVLNGVDKGLDYLVIGVIGSRDWIHSSFGRKIEKAVRLQRAGLQLAIVSEEHFASAVLTR